MGGRDPQLRPGYQEGQTLGRLNPTSRFRRVQRGEGRGLEHRRRRAGRKEQPPGGVAKVGRGGA